MPSVFDALLALHATAVAGDQREITVTFRASSLDELAATLRPLRPLYLPHQFPNFRVNAKDTRRA